MKRFGILIFVSLFVLTGCNIEITPSGDDSDPITLTVTSLSPADGATDVAVDTVLTATLSQMISCVALPVDPVFLKDEANSTVDGTVGCSGNTLTFTPSETLEPNTTYAVTLKAGIAEATGVTLDSDASWSFTTGAIWQGLKTLATDDGGYTAGVRIEVDQEDSVYVLGYAQGVFKGQSKTGFSDTYIAKYNSIGEYQWSDLIGVTDEAASPKALLVNSDNDLLIFGETRGDLFATLDGTSDGYIAKYSNDGTFQWGQQFGNGGEILVWGAALDSSEDMYVAINTNTSLDDTVDLQNGHFDAGLLKLNSAGEYQWAVHVGASLKSASPTGVATDSSDNVIMYGHLNFDLDAENTLSGSRDGFVVKYDSAGNKLWGAQFGGDADTIVQPTGVAVDSEDNVYVVGHLWGGLTFDGQITQDSMWDGYVTKYNSSGVKQWTTLMSISGGYVDIQAITIDQIDNIYINGSTTTAFPGNTMASGECCDGYNAKLDTDGNIVWVTQYSNTPEWEMYERAGIATNSLGEVFSTGEMYNPTTNIGAGYIMKMDTYGTVQ